MTQRPTILVVDDEESYREALSVAFEREGFDVVTAADGPEAIDRFDATHPALVLLDVMLPRMSGVDVCRELRTRSQVPIIMVYEKNNEKLAAIYGFSYENRAVKENKSLEYSIKDESIPYHIATLHGSIYGNKEHDPYATFQLKDLLAKSFDYWALGHIHQRKILADSPPIVYSGNIQGRHRLEAGEKGCYYVQLSNHQTKLEFIELQSIQFESLQFNITGCQNIFELEQKLTSYFSNQDELKLIDITFLGNNSRFFSFEKEGLLQELIEVMNEQLINNDYWHYIYTYRIEVDAIQINNFHEVFAEEMNNALEQMILREELLELYNHPKGRKFLDILSEDEIKTAAKQYLVHELFKGKEGAKDENSAY